MPSRGAQLLSALGLLGLLGRAAPARAEPEGYLALGAFEEQGRGVRGHGKVLEKALAYELSHSGAFALVAGEAAKAAAIERIHATNRHSVDERHWVRIGRAVGATHLLLGEVRQDRNTCSAFAQLVHLETRATKVTRPEYYDCTNYDLVDLAGDLSAQLVGRRASPAQPRRHRRPPERPVSIVMRGREASVDGRGYTFYELKEADGAEAATGRDDAPPKREQAAAPRPPGSPAPPAPAETPGPDPASTPAPGPSAADPTPRPTSSFDAERWPALRPYEDPAGAPIFNLYALGCLLDRRAPLFAGLTLTVPVFFLLVGALLLRAKESLGGSWLRFGLGASVLFAGASVATMLVYRYDFGRSPLGATAPLLLLAPFGALLLWLVGGRLMRVLPHLRLLRQVAWLFLSTLTVGALGLIATQIQAPALYFGLAAVGVWFGLRLAVAFRNRRKPA